MKKKTEPEAPAAEQAAPETRVRKPHLQLPAPRRISLSGIVACESDGDDFDGAETERNGGGDV